MSDPRNLDRSRVEQAMSRGAARSRERAVERAEPAEREGTLSKGEPMRISFQEMLDEAVDRDPGLVGQVSGDDVHQARGYCPVAAVPLDDAPPLDGAIVFYECNGHRHPVTVFAPHRSAVKPDGSLVADDDLPPGYNLHDALNGAYGEITANILYYLQSWCFHPGAIPEPGPGHRPSPLRGEPREVVTIDTAELPHQTTKGFYSSDGEEDQWPGDAVTGHGHAIADLIGRMVGEKTIPKLFGMRPLAGHTYQLQFKDGRLIRGFTGDMLLENLKEADVAYPDAAVLNLSLGAPNTPLAMRFEPIGRWITEWISQGENRAVVAAAGNHQTCVPNWPAAHCADWDNPTGTSAAKRGDSLKHRDRIFSVGSELFYDSVQKSRGKERFSAQDDRDDSWIGYQRVGREVEVECPDPDDTVWTGTSFAAPQVSAELAMGKTPEPQP